MKFILFAVCCFISTMHYSVEGGLVKDFFGKVKETAQVIHKDVKEIWRPENDDTNTDHPDHGDQGVTTSPTTSVPPSAVEDNQAEKKEVSKVTEKTPDVNEKKSDKPTTPTPASTTAAVAVKEIKHEETTTVSSTTTEKEGRENFTGGCTTGYKRTPDGRCMPSF